MTRERSAWWAPPSTLLPGRDSASVFVKLESPSTTFAIVSSDRGRAHTAGDILGTQFTPTDWSEELVLDVFFRYDLPN